MYDKIMYSNDWAIFLIVALLGVVLGAVNAHIRNIHYPRAGMDMPYLWLALAVILPTWLFKPIDYEKAMMLMLLHAFAVFITLLIRVSRTAIESDGPVMIKLFNQIFCTLVAICPITGIWMMAS